MEKKLKLFTHLFVDIDAVASAWFYLRFVFKKTTHEVDLVFKPANWDGRSMSEEDVALDISAGGKGIKGDRFNNKTMSCFMALFNKHKESLNSEEKHSLRSLGKFIDLHDSGGIDAWKNINCDGHAKENRRTSLLYFSGLLMVLHGYHTNLSDFLICLRMFENFDNYLKLSSSNFNIKDELDKVEYIGKVAIIREAKIRINNKLFNDGFKFVVFVDGKSIGILSKDRRLPADNIFCRKIIEKAGEVIGDGEESWFAHPDGRLFCRGSRKSPVKTFSKVDPEKLAEAANNYLSFLQDGRMKEVVK